MPRKRDPRRDEAFEIWKEHKGEITNRDIAKQLDVPEKTISAWKSRDKWNVVLQKSERSTTKRRGTKRARAPSKRSGNHNPKNQFAKRNNAAEKFGFFSKYLPPESVEIMQEINTSEPADLLWDQIIIQYTAIIRAQKIMLVLSKEDETKVLKRAKKGDGISELEYELQFAWDKQANFLNAQSRAMSELRALIKQFVAIADEQDERRKRIDLMAAQISKINYSMADQDNAEDKVGKLFDKLEGAFNDGHRS